MTDLIDRYQETVRDLEEPSLSTVGNGNVVNSAILNDNSFRIMNANGNIVMEVTSNGDIHFYGNLVVHGSLNVDGEIRAEGDIRGSRVWNAVFN